MSFILDALRKSETERQHKGSAEFANVPTSDNRREGPPAWLWVFGVLLLINLAVLVGILMRSDVDAAGTRADTSTPVASPAEAPVETRSRDNFADRVAAARESAPPRDEPAPPPAEEPATPPVQESASTTRVTAEPLAASRSPLALPTSHEVRAQGLLALPDLHVDIHVFSESAPDRFVFINMVKHKEGSRLAEGPLVEEITPDGVVLSMNGTTFLLPRD